MAKRQGGKDQALERSLRKIVGLDLKAFSGSLRRTTII